MKANISSNGRLELIPENEIECYALSKWFIDDLEEKGEIAILPFDNPSELLNVPNNEVKK